MFNKKRDEIHSLQLQVKELQGDQNRHAYLLNEKIGEIEKRDKVIGGVHELINETLKNHKKAIEENQDKIRNLKTIVWLLISSMIVITIYASVKEANSFKIIKED